MTISAQSTLVVKGEQILIEALELDGALEIDVADGGSLTIRSLTVRNAGWQFVALSDAESASAEEATAIRGFRIERTETRTIRVQPGEHVVIEGGEERKPSEPPAEQPPPKKSSAPGAPSPAPPIKVEPANRACPFCLQQ